MQLGTTIHVLLGLKSAENVSYKVVMHFEIRQIAIITVHCSLNSLRGPYASLEEFTRAVVRGPSLVIRRPWSVASGPCLLQFLGCTGHHHSPLLNFSVHEKRRGRKCCSFVSLLVIHRWIVKTILIEFDRISCDQPSLTYKMRRYQGISLRGCVTLLLGIQCQSFLHVPSFYLASRATSLRMVEGILPAAMNGDVSLVSDDINITECVHPDDLLPLAPPVSFEKYLTMQVCASFSFHIGVNGKN